MGLLVAYKDYGFIFKMKMTEVSNPMQRKQKRLGMSSNSFDLENTATLSEMWRLLPGDGTVLNYLRKVCNTEKDRMNSGLHKTCRSLTAECSLASNSLPPFLSWSEAILLDPKILRVDLTTKFHFQSQQPITKKRRKKKGGDLWKCLLCLLFPRLPCITGYQPAFSFLGLFLLNFQMLP